MPTVDDTSSFDGITELRGEKLADEAKDLLSSSATRRVQVVDGDGVRFKESRLSEVLADEVDDAEKSIADYPVTFEDYEKQVQEILEAERAELLETEAIMNAPPGAEDIIFPQTDDDRGNNLMLDAERAELLETQAIINAPPAAEDTVVPPRDDDLGNEVILEADQAELLETQAIINALPGAADVALPPRDDDCENNVSLEAKRAELLETQAIINAPPGAEDIAFPVMDDDRSSDGRVYDELSLLEMDEVPEQGNTPDSTEMGSSVGYMSSFHDDIKGATPSPSKILSIKDPSNDITGVDEPNGWGVNGIDINNDIN